jgi:acyl carrier protein
MTEKLGVHADRLAVLIADLLELENDFDRSKSFIELGGQSIMAIQLQMKVLEEYGVRLAFVDILRHGTVNELGIIIQQGKTRGHA